ncbi:MAG: hybrid sensor histidine kinase/response regulator [Pirellula sp.]|nr:hybrid sensor histidine kinase/response regulator [Pirellula sp.]
MESSNLLIATLDRLGAWGVVTTDSNLVVTGWNRWLEQRSGKAARDVVGRRIVEIYPDLLVRAMDRYYRQALEGQACLLSQRFHKYLLPMPPTVAHTHLMNMQQTARLMPLLEDEVICGTLTLIEDVTERIVTEEELRKQADRLEEANRHKDDFLAMLAHELRNPLGPIRNGLQVLDFIPGDSPDAIQTRQMMERQVTHMSRLVDDLLDVSRIARGKVRLRQTLCDLNSIVHDVVEDYRPLIEKNGIRLVLLSLAEDAAVCGDSIRLAQIVGNLLNNANKFTNPGGEIRVACETNRETKSVLIRISDTGIGMSRETLLQIFDTFSQADESLDRSKGGLGLGLSLAKGLANLHGGAIQASSDGVGRGSSFTLSVPLTESGVVETTPAAEPAIPNQEMKRILVIEDNRDMAQSMKMLLSHIGYQVEWADSGNAGLDLARRFSPSIVLCDIGLPGRNGFEVARALRADPITEHAYLIAQSGYGQDEDVRKAHDAGFDLHLTKPVDFIELKRVLSAVPGSHKSESEIDSSTRV